MQPIIPPIIEEVIVETIIKCAKMRDPLSVQEIIEFTNSFIKESEFQENGRERTLQTYQKMNMIR
jgi:hypothetical protein